jgi:hypothetical protein
LIREGVTVKTTTLTMEQAKEFLRFVRIADVKDIRAVDTDLLLVLKTGERIVLTDGVLLSVTQPELLLTFRDGTLRLEQIFQQIEKIEPNAIDGDVPSLPDQHVMLDCTWKWLVF